MTFFDMKFWKRTYKTLFLLIMMNSPLIVTRLNNYFVSCDSPGQGLLSIWLRVTVCVAFIVLLAALEILPHYEKGLNFRLLILAGGYELIITSFYALAAELIICIVLFRRMGPSSLFLINLAVAYCVLLFHYLNGFWRTAFCSSQLGLGRRIVMFFLWWVFPINAFLFYRWCRIVRMELITARSRYLLDAARVENAICRTRYPVIMVHGIFFRDWHYLNYWGRIPRFLKQNGALVYYGRQQSSLAVADSAAELKSEIERVLAETGAEKVNIVAHSKGGLDSRYAISRLGMAERVASLTTINTPHRGCRFADVLLERLPKWLIHYTARRYNALFYMLGDDRPDFLAGVKDLTASACALFNETVPDAPGVYYQSVMSKMHNHRSAFFPLNIGYLLSKKYEGDNDGLVSVSSAAWGNYLGLLSAGKKGISHADMIDLTHKDLKGFDVGEFYVKLLSGLKERGF